MRRPVGLLHPSQWRTFLPKQGTRELPVTKPFKTRNYDPLISLIVPVFNEQDVVEIFLENTAKVMQDTGLEYEYLFVNDGSTDATAAVASAHGATNGPSATKSPRTTPRPSTSIRKSAACWRRWKTARIRTIRSSCCGATMDFIWAKNAIGQKERFGRRGLIHC